MAKYVDWKKLYVHYMYDSIEISGKYRLNLQMLLDVKVHKNGEMKPYYNSDSDDVEMIDVLKVDNFITAWNNLDDADIDDVYLYLHGGEGVLYFKGESMGMTGDNSMESLSSKTVGGQLYLFSCKGGKGEEGNNVAW